MYTTDQFREALIKNDTDLIKTMIQSPGFVNVKDDKGSTPLHMAAGNGKVDVVKTLLEAEAEIEAADKFGRTPLHWAAYNGKVDGVKALLKAGAKIDATDNLGCTPLLGAVEYSKVDVVKTLIEAGADTFAKERDGKTALDLAGEYFLFNDEFPRILDFLQQAMTEQELERGLREITEAEKKDVAKTFFHGLVTCDPLECLDALEGNIHRDLREKIESFEGSEEDRAKLTEASKPENDINAIRSFECLGKKNALHLLAKQTAFNQLADLTRTYAEVYLDMLVNDGEGARGLKMDINARDVQGKTPLHIAIVAGNIGIIPQLALHKADLTAKFGYEGRVVTPLEYAMIEGNEVLAQAIINIGQDCGCDTTEVHPNIKNLAEFALGEGMVELSGILKAIEEAKMAAHAPSDGAGGGAASSAQVPEVDLLAQAPEAPAE